MKFNIIKLNKVNSTNLYLKELVKNTTVDNLTVVIARNQTAGIGQNNNKWISASGKNLTLSIYYIHPFNVELNKIFIFNMCIALAVRKCVNILTGQVVKIKWANDIVVDDKKISGLLIENLVIGNSISSIIGIGLNVNQTIFPDFEGLKATSLKLIVNKSFRVSKVLDNLLGYIEEYLNQYEKRQFSAIKEEYNKNLYLINEPFDFIYDNAILKGKILGVNEYGQLIIQNLQSGGIKLFNFNEIKYKYK